MGISRNWFAMPAWLSKYPLSVSVKLLVISEVVLLGTLFGLLLHIRSAMRQQVIEDLQHEIQGIATTAAIQLNGDDVKLIRSSDDAKSPAFLRQRTILTGIRDVNKLSYNNIYTFYRDGDKVRFGVMTQDPF